MCKSKADGGQRCYAHARKALDAAYAAYEALAPERTLAALGATQALSGWAEAAVEGRILRAQLELASTERGREEFRTQADAARRRGEDDVADRLEGIIERGALLAERNAALAAALRTPVRREPSRRSGMTLSAEEIREFLSMSLTEEQAAGVCRDLTETLAKLTRSATHRRRMTPRSRKATTGLLDLDEVRRDGARLAFQWAAFDDAEQRWSEIQSTGTKSATKALKAFVRQTRQARDTPPTGFPFKDDYRRDNNFVLRVCGEIVAAHASQEGPALVNGR